MSVTEMVFVYMGLFAPVLVAGLQLGAELEKRRRRRSFGVSAEDSKRLLRTLTEAVRSEGYELVIAPAPEQHPDALGQPLPNGANVLSGDRIACQGDTWDYAYSCSHEIAEHRHGFQHTADMFAEQCNILARWHRLRSGR